MEMYDNTARPMSVSEIVGGAQAARFVIQDYCPLADSLEWELGQSYLDRGSRAFSGDQHIPYAINNDGDASVEAAELLLSSLIASEEAGSLGEEIRVLEIGPGLGLFARLFLDAFRTKSAERGKDYYERLTYVVGDRSPQMLADMCRRGVFGDHPARYQLRVMDALCPDEYLRTGAALTQDTPFRAVFLNYLLDALPATVLKFDADSVKQLRVRTCLGRGVRLNEYTDLSPEDLVRLANCQDHASKRELAGVFDLLASEYAYQTVDPSEIPYCELATAFAQSKTCRYVLHNYGAIQSLERLFGLLQPQGFILINDYGSSEVKDCEAGFEHQRYGDSVFVGINFPLLEEHFRGRQGRLWIAPTEDNGHIYSRLVATELQPAIAEQFRNSFGKGRFEWKHEPAQTATSCVKAGRFESAAIAFREALERQPYNWMLMSEIAKFLIFSLRDPNAGFETTRAALALNPCSCELWNTLGDALFVQERVTEARGAFLRALELDPQDVRARYNLSFVFVHERDYPSALRVIADALALDMMGAYRDGLLRQQAVILERIARRNRERDFRMANRVTDTARSFQLEPSAPAAGSVGAHSNAVRKQ